MPLSSRPSGPAPPPHGADAPRAPAAEVDGPRGGLGGASDLSGGQRVLERCQRLAEYTDAPAASYGVPRPLSRRFLSNASASAQSTTGRWFAAAGLNVLIDAAGNLVGHRRAAVEDPGSAPVLLLGSHLDTVPGSGHLDGAMGVLAALEVVERLGDTPLPFHIDVVGSSEEGGVRFGLPYLGSRAMTGTLPDDILTRRDADGISVRAAIETFGLNPLALHNAAYRKDRVLGYVELHIEQGPVLRDQGQPLGIVSGIQGQSRLLLKFRGRSSHAGTAPMDGRCDPLVAAARLILETQDYGRSLEGLRATVGRIEASPNLPNLIPGEVLVSLDVRHALDELREVAVVSLLELAKSLADADGMTCEVLKSEATPAGRLDGGLMRRLTQAARHEGHDPIELPSGSGHDAVVFGESFPAAMVFLRQVDDLTDRSVEEVKVADVDAAIDTLTRFVCDLVQPEDPFAC